MQNAKCKMRMRIGDDIARRPLPGIPSGHNPYPCLPLGEGGSRVPRKRETDEGFLPQANVKCRMQNAECKMRTWIGDDIARRPLPGIPFGHNPPVLPRTFVQRMSLRTSDRCHWCGNLQVLPRTFVQRMSLRTSPQTGVAIPRYFRTLSETHVIANQCAHWCGNPFPKAFPWRKVPAAAGG